MKSLKYIMKSVVRYTQNKLFERLISFRTNCKTGTVSASEKSFRFAAKEGAGVQTPVVQKLMKKKQPMVESLPLLSYFLFFIFRVRKLKADVKI